MCDCGYFVNSGVEFLDCVYADDCEFEYRCSGGGVECCDFEADFDFCVVELECRSFDVECADNEFCGQQYKDFVDQLLVKDIGFASCWMLES